MKPNRYMPMWPTYFARVVATAIFLAAPFLLRSLPFIRDGEHPLLLSFGISGCAAILVGSLVLHLCEWLVNAHLDSIETKSRFNFGLMILTAGLLAVGVATIALQWQK